MSFKPSFDLEKHIYVLGALETTTTSTPYKPVQKMYFTGATVTLNTPPSGSGSTVVKLIRNNDPTNVIYTATFNANDATVNITNSAILNATDSMSLNISSVASTTPGSDLVFKLTYHN